MTYRKPGRFGLIGIILATTIVLATILVAIHFFRAAPDPKAAKLDCDSQPAKDMIARIYGTKKLDVARLQNIKTLERPADGGAACSADVALASGETGTIAYHMTLDHDQIDLKITGAK